MKFWAKNRGYHLNVIIVGEYNLISRHYFDLFLNHSPFNVFVFKWESMHRDSTTWTYPNFVRFIEQALKQIKIEWQKTILIGHGIGGSIVNWLANFLQPLGICVVSPVFYTNLVNPFATRIPSYKPNLKSVYLNLHKLYVEPGLIYGAINSLRMIKYYDYYLKNMMFFETIRAQVSHYETLLDLKKKEQQNYRRNMLLIGDSDRITNFKETVQLCQRMHFQNQWNLFLFNDVAHCALFEKKEAFFQLLNDAIKEWLASVAK